VGYKDKEFTLILCEETSWKMTTLKPQKQDVGMWNGLSWLKTVPNGRTATFSMSVSECEKFQYAEHHICTADFILSNLSHLTRYT
jgi:hypothetical protein